MLLSAAAKDQLFEFNDEITRANFVNIVEPFLRDVQAKRGITDFVVICDETNNTAAIIDSNELLLTYTSNQQDRLTSSVLHLSPLELAYHLKKSSVPFNLEVSNNGRTFTTRDNSFKED